MKALVVSDKNSEDVKTMMKFYFGFTPGSVVAVNHYHELSNEQRDQDDVLIHVQQPPIATKEDQTLSVLFDLMSTSPYNQPTSWIQSFNYAVISTIDDKSERKYQMLHS